MFLSLFVYYSALHPDGITSQRYMISVIFPLTLLSGIVIGNIAKNKSILLYSLLLPIAIFTIITTIIPISFHNQQSLMVDRNLKYFVFHDADGVKKEHNKYKALCYENRLTRILNLETDIKKGEKTYFIVNGERSFLHTMPVNGIFVDTWKEEELYEIEEKITDQDIVYASQSEMGFTSHLIDGYNPINPKAFEEIITDIFTLEEILISYYAEDHHVFLYKMRKK